MNLERPPQGDDKPSGPSADGATPAPAGEAPKEAGSNEKAPGWNAARRPTFLAVFPSIMLPMFLAVLDQTIVATALPSIAASTAECERASWAVVSYLIASTIAAPIYGRLGDSFGRRRLMFIALTVFIVSSLLCALSYTVISFTPAR